MTNSSNQNESIDMMSQYDITAPVGKIKALPITALGRGRGRKVVYTKDVEQLAINIFDSSKKAITVGHIVAQFGVNKEHARRINKRCVANHVLFAPEISLARVFQ